MRLSVTLPLGQVVSRTLHTEGDLILYVGPLRRPERLPAPLPRSANRERTEQEKYQAYERQDHNRGRDDAGLRRRTGHPGRPLRSNPHRSVFPACANAVSMYSML